MGTEHHDTDSFRGATFRRVDLSGASFREVDLSRVTVRDSDVRGLRIVASMVDDVHLSGHEGVGRVVVDDVEVTEYVRAELDRRHPERIGVRDARTAAALRAAWAEVDHLWDVAVSDAARLPESRLHERVHDEWSFVETMRHLVFAVDGWVGRMLGGTSAPYHPWGLPPTDATEAAAAEMGLDLAATPGFVAVADLHRQRRQSVTAELAGVTDEALSEVRRGVLSPEWGEESFPVLDCLRTVLREHAEHLRFTLRDLAELARNDGD